MKFLRDHWLPLVIIIAALIAVINEMPVSKPAEKNTVAISQPTVNTYWKAPDIDLLGNDSLSGLIRYGKDLIANTAVYLGPKGKVAAITNGMNCQNCHIEAGAKPFGNCLSAVASTYPVFKPRSGITESIEFRINDCMQRSLNGKTIDSTGREMRAMVAYMKWLGKDVPKGTKPVGAGVGELSFINRAADPEKGKTVFAVQCSRCHGANGEGQPNVDNTAYTYPPLWGPHSYNIGAGLYRISKLAAYVKENMPFEIASHENPQLTDEEAWDVAAFINSQPRPVKKFAHDWPDISKKAFDYPFGPYKDGFSELQHKYGPFDAIKKAARPAAK